MTDTQARVMRPYGCHRLICEHGDCAEPKAAHALQQRFRELAQARGPRCAKPSPTGQSCATCAKTPG